MSLPVLAAYCLRALTALVLACCLAPVPALPAPAPSPLLSDYTHTAWSGLQGAPFNVMKVAQTRDGWLWLATPSGLYRYDGVRFERVDSVYGQRLESSTVVGLAASPDGGLWVGYFYGGVTLLRPDGRGRSYGVPDGLPPEGIFHIEIAPDGTVWVGGAGGVGTLAPGASRFEKQAENVGLPGRYIVHVLFARDGTQWMGSFDGAWYRRPGQARFTQAWPRTALMSMAEGPDGSVWASDKHNRYFRVRTAPPPPGRPYQPEYSANALRFDRDGTMWLLTQDAIERKPAGMAPGAPAQRLTRSAGMSGLSPQCFFQDREGNLWIGTSGGIDRLRRNRVRTMPVVSRQVVPGLVAAPDGGAWLSDDTGLRSLTADGPGKIVFPGHMTASHRAPDGALWIAGGEQLRRRAPDGSVQSVALPPGSHEDRLQAIQQDRSGGLWVVISGDGLYRRVGGQWLRDGGLAGLPRVRILTMTMDAAGRVWLGHAANLISVVDPGSGRVQVLGTADGLQAGALRYLVRDGEGVWAGGERGFALYRGGRFVPLYGTGGERFRGVSGVTRLPDGELWLQGVDGIYRIPAADMAAWLRDPGRTVAYERLDALDGLQGQAPPLRPIPSMVRTAAGQLWFLTGNSIAMIDPAHLARNPLPPPVLIRSLSADRKQYVPGAAGQLRLPQGSDNLQVDFTALSLSMPERVRFRHRLEGVDHGWQDTGSRREAYYTNLAPGRYRFQVTAANEDGVWNEEGAAVDVMIPPTFVQTRWFTLLLAVAAGLLLWGAYRLRIRALARRMDERLEERLAERSRIARSLHDTLLQGVQGLLMSIHAHAHGLPPGTRERERLDGMLAMARRLLVEGRDEIMELRTADTPEELGRVLREFGAALGAHAEFRFEMRSEGKARVLRADVREGLHGIGREALFNSARHARASHVLLELAYAQDAVVLRVSDDGCGIEAGVAAEGQRPGHVGLPGMRERAAGIGARLRVDSAPGAGTTIEASVPAAQAYAPVRRRWFALRRARVHDD